MNIDFYFEPLSFSIESLSLDDQRKRIGHDIQAYLEDTPFPDLSDVQVVIMGVGESRYGLNNLGCENAPDEIRKQFYTLFPPQNLPKIADIGNLKIGRTVEDTYCAVADVLSQLVQYQIVPIILGGSQDLTYAMYQAYANLKHIVNVLVVDNRFDIGDPEHPISSQNYMSKMIVSQPNYLFNYTNIGYQTYLEDKDSIELIDQLYFDAYRLGAMKGDIQEAEPLIRNVDIFSLDISAIRQSDAPANLNASPFGFFAEDVCQMARYAGMSDKLSSIGFYEMNPLFDNQGQTAKLVATMIWYFIEAFALRKDDFPATHSDIYTKFVVPENHEGLPDMIFYKNKTNDRWWMEVPCSEAQLKIYERHYIIPCSYRDYEKALNNETPERWLLAYKKLL